MNSHTSAPDQGGKTAYARNTAHDTTGLPVAPRRLTADERRRRDVYCFRSPKLGRMLDVITALNAAHAFLFEFNPQILTYVERPRTLELPDRRIELDFWTREHGGRESYWLTIPNSQTEERSSSRREYREQLATVEAAQRSHIRVEFVYESYIERQASKLATWYRILPYVQTATGLSNRSIIAPQILQLFDTLERCTFAQIESALPAYHPADIRAVACWLVHRGDLDFNNPERLTRFSVLERGRGCHGRA